MLRRSARFARTVLRRPPVLLFLGLCAFPLLGHGVVADAPRWGLDLAGGRLLPVGDLASTWSDYLAAWHPVAAGTGAPAPASLLVLALLGTVLAPIGGPPAAVALLVLFEVPLAGVTAHAVAGRLTGSRPRRMFAAAAYALLPLAAVSAAQGRLDVVVAHVLLPPVLWGAAAVLELVGSAHWLGTACRTALGLAVIGAFAPLVHAVVLVLVLAGFVVLPGGGLTVRRRIAGVGLLVLLPVACLLPWPVVLLDRPGELVRGIGAQVGEPSAGPGLLALSPGGAGFAVAGGLVVLAALAAAVLAPARRMVPGAVVAAGGWASALLVGSTGWAGGPLLVVAAGLLGIVLTAGTPQWRVPALRWVLIGPVVLLAFAAVLGVRGPLRVVDGPAPERGTVLQVQPGQQSARWLPQRGPRFGDDDLAPAPSAGDWLRSRNADLLSTDPDRIRGALAAAAAHGVDAVRVPRSSAAALRAQADMVADQGGSATTADLRLLPPHAPVQLLGPDLARQARKRPTPPPEDRPLPVEAGLPTAAVRVSEGGSGRLLVLGTANEPGWRASVNGREMPLATAWDAQVAVPLPPSGGEVRVSYTTAPRTGLLAVQAAALLFAVIGALPERALRLGAGSPPASRPTDRAAGSQAQRSGSEGAREASPGQAEQRSTESAESAGPGGSSADGTAIAEPGWSAGSRGSAESDGAAESGGADESDGSAEPGWSAESGGSAESEGAGRNGERAGSAAPDAAEPNTARDGSDEHGEHSGQPRTDQPRSGGQSRSDQPRPGGRSRSDQPRTGSAE